MDHIIKEPGAILGKDRNGKGELHVYYCGYRRARISGGTAILRELMRPQEQLFCKVLNVIPDNHVVYVVRVKCPAGYAFECAFWYSDFKVYVTDDYNCVVTEKW